MKISEQLRKADQRSAATGLELADLLRKKWRNVNYNSKTMHGTADLGHIHIEWEESGNEDKVWVMIRPKGRTAFHSAESAQKAVEQINKLLGGLG
jgi:hypothetical protein